MEELNEKKEIMNNNGFVFTTADGIQYFVIGKSRIKISEHFATNGKQCGDLLEGVIQHAAQTC